MKTALLKIKSILGLQQTKTLNPQPQTVLQNNKISKLIDDQGYYVGDFLDIEKCKELMSVFDHFYNDKNPENGAFMGVISEKVHLCINNIVIEKLNEWFCDFNTINAFVVKIPGNKSFVPLHQDVAAVDELKFSAINVWIPLQDITKDNGVMYIVPHSHRIFSPYRGANIDALTKNIEKELQPYFIPLYIKRGQALIFDSRMFHFSPPNLSQSNRVVTVCRIFPKAAKMISFFKDCNHKDNVIEMWQCEDDYLLKKNGYDDSVRPPHAKLIGYKKADTTPLSVEEFEKRRKALGIEVQENAIPKNEYFSILNQEFSVGFERP